MTIDELQQLLDSTAWTVLGQGTYNQVDVSDDELTINGFSGKWVLKRPISGLNTFVNNSQRAVRKWNLLNPAYPAIVSKEGWIAPYLGDSPASDQQIALKLIDIYRRTKNIIGDAAVKGPNFIVYQDQVICIDMDHAYSRYSLTSQEIGIQTIQYNHFLNSCQKDGPKKSVTIIKALLYLEKNLERDVIHDRWITLDMLRMVYKFRQKNELLTPSRLDRILDIITLIAFDDKKTKQITPKFIHFLQLRLRDQRLTSLPLFIELLNQYLLSLASIDYYVSNGCRNEVEILIDYDNSLIQHIDENGYGLLHLAVKCGDIHMMRCLIKAGADLNARVSGGCDMGLSLLDLACIYNSDKIAIFLFDRGVDFSRHKEGRTHIIHVLARNGLLSQIRVLLKLYPELLDATDSSYNTPLQCAKSADYPELVSFLRQVSADNIPVIQPKKAANIMKKTAYLLLQKESMFSYLSVVDEHEDDDRTYNYPS